MALLEEICLTLKAGFETQPFPVCSALMLAVPDTSPELPTLQPCLGSGLLGSDPEQP